MGEMAGGSGEDVPVILLVEDNPADLRLTQEVLEEAAFAHRLLVARATTLPSSDRNVLWLYRPVRPSRSACLARVSVLRAWEIPIIMTERTSLTASASRRSNVRSSRVAHARTPRNPPAPETGTSRYARSPSRAQGSGRTGCFIGWSSTPEKIRCVPLCSTHST
jgi:hypothetical protein